MTTPSVHRRLLSLLPLCLLAATSGLLAQAPHVLSGPWTGRIDIAGTSLQIRVVYVQTPDGLTATIDIPQQHAKALPVRGVRHEGQRVQFELPAGPGLAVFDGTIDEDRIRGTFTQGPAVGTFVLQRGEAPPPPPEAPAESLPYRTEEVTFGHDDVVLAGTLSLPEGKGPFPAVALLSGSGAQTRDEEVAGFKVFRVLADQLTRRGLAVLRFDDRGVGGSTGGRNPGSTTTSDFAADALAAVGCLTRRPEVRRDRVGLLGHSEGALAAVLAAAKSKDVSFIVLLAGPAVAGEQIIRAQAEAIARASGASDADIDRVRAQQDLLFKAVRTGSGWDEVVESARALGRLQLAALPDEQRQALGDPEQYLTREIARQLAGAKTPWFRFFVEFDPAPVLESVTCPMLALFGGRDLQVPLDQNRRVMARVFERAGRTRATIRVYPEANHLFQRAVSGTPSEYPTLERAFVAGLADDIASWILALK